MVWRIMQNRARNLGQNFQQHIEEYNKVILMQIHLCGSIFAKIHFIEIRAFFNCTFVINTVYNFTEWTFNNCLSASSRKCPINEFWTIYGVQVHCFLAGSARWSDLWAFLLIQYGVHTRCSLKTNKSVKRVVLCTGVVRRANAGGAVARLHVLHHIDARRRRRQPLR